MELKQKLQAIWDPFWKSRATWWLTLLSLFMDLKKKLQPSWEWLWKSRVTWWPTPLSLWANLRGKSRPYRAWFYKHRFAWQLLMGLLLIGAMAVGLWKVPQWQLEGEKLEAERRIQLENDLRKTLAQMLAGAFILFGGYLAWRRVTAIELTVAVAQEGQITERFTRAIQLLGDRKNLEVRLGGIYALERIAKDSRKDHWPIMEILTAYVREQARWVESSGTSLPPAEIRPPADIQAIMTVIGRRNRAYEEGQERRLDLYDTDLREALLLDAHLENANLAEAHLEGALLNGVHLEGAHLWNAHLEGAVLDGANLNGTFLLSAHLKDISFLGVDLKDVLGLTREQLEDAITDADVELQDDMKDD